jgi:uncharacterized protein (DUF983 family)
MSERLLFLRRALARKCPQCGEGPIFRAYARMHAECPVCGLRYRREQGAQTGAMYLSAAVTEVFAALVAVSLFLFTDLDAVPGLALGVPLVLLFCYGFLPVSMAVWTSVEYATDVSNGEAWTAPQRGRGTSSSTE